MSEVTIERSKFSHALQTARLIIKANSPNDRHQCVLLRWNKEQVSICSFGDLGMLTVICPVIESDGVGESLLHPVRLEQFVQGGNSDRVRLVEDGEKLKVYCAPGSATFNTLDPSGFSCYDGEPDGTPVDGDALREAMKSAAYLTSDSHGQKDHPAICVDWIDGLFIASSSRNSVSVIGPLHEAKVGQKAKVSHEIARILSKSSGDVSITFDENRVVFASENMLFATPHVNVFMNKYKTAIEKMDETVATLQVSTLMSAVKQASVFTEVESRAIMMTVADGTISVVPKASTHGLSSVSVRCEHTGDDWTKVDHKFPEMFLSLHPADADVTLKIKDANLHPLIMECGNHVYRIAAMTEEA